MDNLVSQKLKNFETMRWLKNRFKNQVKDKYILNDQELKEQIMMKAVFISIDRDKSSMFKIIREFLDRCELYDMFRKYGINITKQKLREFFKKIDQDDDDKLNWNDFKQALQNHEALQMFVELMRKIRASNELGGGNFVPLSFPNMIQYMNYCVLREELIQNIESNELTAAQKVKQCRNLLTLEELCYRNIQNVKTNDNNKDDAEDIAQQSKKSDHQQIAKLRRMQERELFQLRMSRVRKLSTSQYYKSCDTEHFATSRKNDDSKLIELEIKQGIEKASKQYGRIIETLTQEGQISNILKYEQEKNSVIIKPNTQTILRQTSLYEQQNSNSVSLAKYNSVISSDEQDYTYASKIMRPLRRKESIYQTEVPKGSHFINQVFLVSDMVGAQQS